MSAWKRFLLYASAVAVGLIVGLNVYVRVFVDNEALERDADSNPAAVVQAECEAAGVPSHECECAGEWVGERYTFAEVAGMGDEEGGRLLFAAFKACGVGP